MHFKINLWLGRIKKENSDKKYFFGVFFILLKAEETTEGK